MDGLFFTADYDKIVKGKETSFKIEFKSLYEHHEQLNKNRTVLVKNVTLTKGSIIVSFQVEHLQSGQNALLKDLTKEVENGAISVTFNSTVLVPQKTLLVDGNKQVVKSVKKGGENTTTIIIVVVVIIIIIIIVILLFFYCKRYKGRNRAWSDKVQAIEAAEEEDSPSPTKTKNHIPLNVYTTLATNNNSFIMQKESLENDTNGGTVNENFIMDEN